MGALLMVVLNEEYKREVYRDELIKNIREQGIKAKHSINEIVDFIGGSGFHTIKNGIVIGELIVVIAEIFEKLRLYERVTEEDILQHPIRVAKYGQSGPIKDITSRIVEVTHDVPERTDWYSLFKRKYLECKHQKIEIPKEDIIIFQKNKREHIDHLGNIIYALEERYNAGINVGRSKRCVSKITRNPYDPYDVFLNILWAIGPYFIEEGGYYPTDAAITGITKLGDSTDNNSKVPREKYTIPKRTRVGIKGILTINAANIFMQEYDGCVDPIYFKAIKASSDRLRNVIKTNALEDMRFLRETCPHIIGIFDKIDSLSKGYDDFSVKELANPRKLEANHSSMFDGYLIRQLLSVNRQEWTSKYTKLFDEQDRWLAKHFQVESQLEHIRDYSDSNSLASICDYFGKPNIIKSLCNVNKNETERGVQHILCLEQIDKKCQGTTKS